MRYVFLFVLFFSSAAFAGNFFPVGKSGAKTTYWTKSACESAEGQACYDVTSCPLDECVIEQVDDLTKPKFAKAQEQTCADPAPPAEGEQAIPKCQPELEALHCDRGQALIAADRSEVYCAVPNGYEKKNGDMLVSDPTKVAAKQAADAAAAQRAALIAEGLKRQEVGKRLIALITANNDSKNLTADQTAELTTELSPIIQLLQVGAIESAKAKVQALTPDGTLITQGDIDLGLSAFTAEGY